MEAVAKLHHHVVGDVERDAAAAMIRDPSLVASIKLWPHLHFVPAVRKAAVTLPLKKPRTAPHIDLRGARQRPLIASSSTKGG
jgi:hypothetical protein